MVINKINMADSIYKKRIADSLLERKLKSTGAVLVEGPKWCGKTTSMESTVHSYRFSGAVERQGKGENTPHRNGKNNAY